jgi:hypothetical protein
MRLADVVVACAPRYTKYFVVVTRHRAGAV